MIRVLQVASEATPFAKTGGLADVVGALPEAIVHQGCDVALKDRSANGTSASVGLAGRIMRSNRRSWLGRMRPDRGGAAKLSIHARGRIFIVGSSPP